MFIVSVGNHQIISVRVDSLRDRMIFRKMDLLMKNLSQKFCNVLLRWFVLGDTGSHNIIVKFLQLQ